MPAWIWAPAITVAVLWGAASLAVWPFANCRRCNGKGRWLNTNKPDRNRNLRKYLYCSVCRGTGRRIQVRR